ncbi:MAG: sigma-70 family RNA polymerase sigma factor [Dysgonamonadaceae bacterium]|jgi:RNA polymerase sigma-70 factor (ECF subfamily)|nr:sigma-70 family RNA polymerase sigma factor [Dysgonamonadaceae bacterium]
MIIDKTILVNLQQGDLSAFNFIFRAYFNNVKQFIQALVKSKDEAENLAQEVFVKLWEIKDRIDPEKNFGAFLFKISHNISLKYIEKKLKEKSFLSDIAYVLENKSAAADDEYLSRELLLRIELAVEELSEQKKKIYRMSVDEGIETEEIAKILDLNPRTVSNTLRLAINEVRQKVSIILAFIALI